MLPYPSYLRIYEPLGALNSEVRAAVAGVGTPSARLEVLEAEQRTSLARTVAPAVIDRHQASDAYVLRRGGAAYYCPVDMPLRSWLSMAMLVDSVGSAARTLIPPELLVVADNNFLRWRRDNPQAVPHIQQSTWGVPRTWFLLVVEDERTGYDDGAGPSVRYRARIEDAKARLDAAQRVLARVIDDDELLEEVGSLADWLASFSEESWLELDYAGIATFLGDRLADDHSAREIHVALDALSRGDLGTAASAYRSFEERWRVVNAYERAN